MLEQNSLFQKLQKKNAFRTFTRNYSGNTMRKLKTLNTTAQSKNNYPETQKNNQSSSSQILDSKYKTINFQNSGNQFFENTLSSFNSQLRQKKSFIKIQSFQKFTQKENGHQKKLRKNNITQNSQMGSQIMFQKFERTKSKQKFVLRSCNLKKQPILQYLPYDEADCNIDKKNRNIIKFKSQKCKISSNKILNTLNHKFSLVNRNQKRVFKNVNSEKMQKSIFFKAENHIIQRKF